MVLKSSNLTERVFVMFKSIKRAAVILLSLTVVSPPAVIAETADKDLAYYEFASGTSKQYMTAGMADGTKPNVVKRDGREGWELSNAKETTESATINCGLDSSFAYDLSDGTTFEIEVDYYDADRAVFSLVYSAQDRSDRFLTSVFTDGVGSKEVKSDAKMWRTAKFLVQDAKFDNSLENCDFKISANILNSNHGITASTSNGYGSDNGYGPFYSSYYIGRFGRVSTLDPIVIGAVRVRKLETKNPFDLKVTMDTTSNTLFDNEHAKFNYSMENRNDTAYNLNAEYTVYDEDGREVLKKRDTHNISPKAIDEFSVDLGEVPYGILKLKSVFTADGVKNETITEFSHSREAKIANPRLGTNVHFEGSNMYKNDENKIMELISKSGMSSIRDSARWANMERVAGKYAITEMTQRGIDLAEKYGIDSLPIITGDNPNVYGEDTNPPTTDATLEAFKNYSRFIAQQYRGKAYAAESNNEYNIHFPSKTPEEYVKLMKATYEGVKEAAPEMKVIGIDSAGLSLKYLRDIFEAGGLEYMDGISYHPYYHSRGPETSGIIANGISVRNLLKEYGREDAEVWITENGWPTWLGNPISESDQANFHVTTILQNAAWKLFDRYYYYEFANSGVELSYMESQFGIVKSVYDEVPYAARPAYVGVCNANYQLGGTEFKDALGGLSATANDFAYRFTRDNNDGKGKELIAIWTKGDRSEMGIKLGCDSVKMYDFYGNETELYGIDGKYSFAVTDEPIYIVGDFTSFESCTPPIKTSGLIMGGATDDTVEQKINMSNSAGAYIVPEGSTYFDCADKTEFNGGTAVYVVKTPSERFFNKCAQYRIEKDNKIYYHGNIKINSVETVTVNADHKVSNGNVNRWQLTVDITNNRNSTAINGSIKINEPSELVGRMPTITVKDLKPQETRTFNLFMPEVVTKEMRDFSMDTVLDSGETTNITKKMFFTVVPYAKDNKPVIDGVVSPGEYSSDTWFSIKGGKNGENVMLLDKNTSFKGNDDLSAKATMKYDDENLYMFIEVTDDIFCNNNSDSLSWNGDGIQLGIAGENTASGGSYCELAIALTPNGPEIYRHLTNNTKAPGLVENKQLQIVRDGTKTLYEMALPWEEILPNGIKAKSGYRPKFAILINEDDGLGRNSFLEYSQVLGAIGVSKNVGYFSDMYLTD